MVPGTGWTVVVDRDRGAVIGPLDRALWLEIGALALFALIGVLLTFAVGRRLDRLDRDREDALAEQREIALALQRSLLPDLDVPDGLSVSAHYVPAQGVVAVGGDWYDLVDGRGRPGRAQRRRRRRPRAQRRPPRWASCASAARVEGLRGSTPADALTALDRFADLAGAAPAGHRRLRGARPAHGRAALRAGRASAAAADPRATARRPTCRAAARRCSASTPIEPRAQGEVTLRPGDTLVIYTDGLVERPEASIDEGLAILAERAAALAGDIPAMADRLLALVPEPRRDDAAVLVVQLAPVRQPSSVAS